MDNQARALSTRRKTKKNRTASDVVSITNVLSAVTLQYTEVINLADELENRNVDAIVLHHLKTTLQAFSFLDNSPIDVDENYYRNFGPRFGSLLSQAAIVDKTMQIDCKSTTYYPYLGSNYTVPIEYPNWLTTIQLHLKVVRGLNDDFRLMIDYTPRLFVSRVAILYFKIPPGVYTFERLRTAILNAKPYDIAIRTKFDHTDNINYYATLIWDTDIEFKDKFSVKDNLEIHAKLVQGGERGDPVHGPYFNNNQPNPAFMIYVVTKNTVKITNYGTTDGSLWCSLGFVFFQRNVSLPYYLTTYNYDGVFFLREFYTNTTVIPQPMFTFSKDNYTAGGFSPIFELAIIGYPARLLPLLSIYSYVKEYAIYYRSSIITAFESMTETAIRVGEGAFQRTTRGGLLYTPAFNNIIEPQSQFLIKLRVEMNLGTLTIDKDTPETKKGLISHAIEVRSKYGYSVQEDLSDLMNTVEFTVKDCHFCRKLVFNMQLLYTTGTFAYESLEFNPFALFYLEDFGITEGTNTTTIGYELTDSRSNFLEVVRL